VGWFYQLRSRTGPGDELERLIGHNAHLVLTGLIVTEVLQGLRREVSEVAALLARWPLIEAGGFATYEAAAGIFREARRRGVTLSTVDVFLAALALEYGAALFTLDRDFEWLAFTGLRLHMLN
jgi:predicted nucleic acid-binding protein